MDGRHVTIAVAALRVGYGAALVVAPQRLTARWLGDDSGRAGTQVLARALGAREMALHLGVLAVALRGGPVRPWLVASMAGDLADIAATAAGRRGLPPASPVLTALVGGASAAVTAAVYGVVDR